MNRILSVNERGTLTLPKDVREKLGLASAGQVLLECEESGNVVLRPCAVFPIEIYSEQRIAEFQEAEAELEPFMAGVRAALKKAPVSKTPAK